MRQLFRSNQPFFNQEDIYSKCYDQAVGDETFNTNSTNIQLALIQCVTTNLQADELSREYDLQQFLLVVAAALVFLMQAGFAMLRAGSVRIKNVQNTMLKGILNASGTAIAFWILGFALAFGDLDSHGTEEHGTSKTFMGTRSFGQVGHVGPAFWFFQYTLSATAVTIVAGTLAERCQMVAYLWYSMLFSGFIYPIIAHSIWSPHGFLSATAHDPLMGSGVVDFAGASVVHVSGGMVALYATCVLGPRNGRFYDTRGEPLEVPKPFPGHSVALQLLGTMVLWFGWFGYNAGQALVLDIDVPGAVAARAATGTALTAATAGVVALFTNLWLEERRTGEASFSLTVCRNGSLAGLVASSAGCALLEPWANVVVGLVAGWIYLWGSKLLIRLRIDDAVDAIPVHFFNGAWGMISTGLLASPALMKDIYGNHEGGNKGGFFYTYGSSGGVDATLLLNQCIALLFVFGWTFAIMFPFFIWLDYMSWFRADSLEEMVGLDISYHGTSVSNGKSKETIKKEYFEAYKRRKERRKKRGDAEGVSGVSGVSMNSNFRFDSNFESYVSEHDPDVNQDAAQEEGEKDEQV